VALHLAALDPSPNVIYLARPCQFEGIRSVDCARTYWTDGRFAQEVIDAYSEAISAIMKDAQATQLHLVGYSGGGGIALLLASQRSDVVDVRTVAGNLDHAAWTSIHHISPLSASLNPADFSAKLTTIPQLHFVGDEDEVMPRTVAEAYRHRFADSNCVTIATINGANHGKGWAEQWPSLLTSPITCARKPATYSHN
jgi:pimeloyl-ACP methyl ester carboxylesterase